MTSEPDRTDAPISLFCARCAAELKPGCGDFYRINIEAVADPSPPVVTTADLATDLRRRIERLLAQMHGLSEQEAMDQIYRRLTIYLCGPCFRKWIENPAS